MNKIPFNIPPYVEDEERYVNESILSHSICGDNTFTFRCEEYMEEKFKCSRIHLTTSGTTALEMACMLADIGPGDEVILPSFTFSSTANAILIFGGTPVFIDIRKDTKNIDENLIERAITPKTKAIMVVHYAGMVCDMNRIGAISEKYGIPVIEDAAEGMGSRWKGRVLGTFGEYGVLSFNGNKMITTSGGGALICKDQAAKDKIMWYATQAREAYPYYQHEAIGYNYRLSNICAGIGRGQMTVLNEHINHHKHIAKLYREAFASINGITFHDAPSADYDANFWLCTILLDENLHVHNEEEAYAEAIHGAVGGAAGVVHSGGSVHTDCEPNRNVEAMRLCLDKAGIESRPLWKPMHKQPVFKNAPAYTNGIAEAMFKRGLCMPSGPMVTDEDVNYIIENIKNNIL